MTNINLESIAADIIEDRLDRGHPELDRDGHADLLSATYVVTTA